MQKLDFVLNLEIIYGQLHSDEILNVFNEGFAKPGSAFEYNRVISLLFKSKSMYDKIKSNDELGELLTTLGGEEIYTETNLSTLTQLLRKGVAANTILTNPQVVTLYNFHNTLAKTTEFARKFLSSNLISGEQTDDLNNGIIVLRVLIDGEALEIEKYVKIFTLLKDLIETICKIYKIEDTTSDIILLDSGSGTNIGLKSSIAVAQSLFLIFKEIWDFVTSHKIYKQKKINEAIIDSLTVRKEIIKSVSEKILSEEEGKEYLHLIKTRMDDLLRLKVLPKEIVSKQRLIDSKKLLNEYENLKLLES